VLQPLKNATKLIVSYLNADKILSAVLVVLLPYMIKIPGGFSTKRHEYADVQMKFRIALY